MVDSNYTPRLPVDNKAGHHQLSCTDEVVCWALDLIHQWTTLMHTVSSCHHKQQWTHLLEVVAAHTPLVEHAGAECHELLTHQLLDKGRVGHQATNKATRPLHNMATVTQQAWSELSQQCMSEQQMGLQAICSKQLHRQRQSNPPAELHAE